MATPSDWHKFRWHEPGVWVLMRLLMVLYAPCFPFVRMDRRDWKPIKTNKGAYFKDAVNGSASFRVCFGFIACAPAILSCPPRCCVRRMGQQTSTKKALSVIHREEDSQRLEDLGIMQNIRWRKPQLESASEADIIGMSPLAMKAS